jgi:hypothetical protein
MMAEIGKRTGVATLFGFKVHGFLAWWIWRTYYLSNLPTIKKKLKVIGDWTMDLIYKPDVSMIKKQMLLREEGQRAGGGERQGKQATEKKESKKSTTGSNEESHQQPRQRSN